MPDPDELDDIGIVEPLEVEPLVLPALEVLDGTVVFDAALLLRWLVS